MNLAELKKTSNQALLFARLLPTRPRELIERMSTYVEVCKERLWARAPAPAYHSSSWEEVIARVEECLKAGLKDFLQEPPIKDIEGEVRQGIERLRHKAPYSLTSNADFTLARLCYVICRAMKPRVVLETGVGYGVTTAFILKALEANQRGTLYSVDLPPLAPGADRFVGILVPESLRSRWRLRRGLSRRLLPSLLPELGQVEIFLHDSLHTWSTMYWEFQTVMPYLTRPGMIMADDVDDNPAFLDWVNSSNPAFWASVSQAEKEGFFGVSVYV